MQEALYIEADGSMLLTLEESWKKVKLGRIFKASDCIHADEKAGWISNSQYVAHLGGHKKFTLQMELKNLADRITHLKRNGFIAEGWLHHKSLYQLVPDAM